jgi:hypothetical protein
MRSVPSRLAAERPALHDVDGVEEAHLLGAVDGLRAPAD